MNIGHDYFGIPFTTVLGILVIGVLIVIGKTKLLLPIILWMLLSAGLLLIDSELPVRLISFMFVLIIILSRNWKKV